MPRLWREFELVSKRSGKTRRGKQLVVFQVIDTKGNQFNSESEAQNVHPQITQIFTD